MTVYQYRCAPHSLCSSPRKGEWVDEGTGPHANITRSDPHGDALSWREKPAAEYLGDFGPNSSTTNGLREAAMERVGELEAGDIAYYNADGSKPTITEVGLKTALQGVYVGAAAFINSLNPKPGGVIRVDAFGDTPQERAKFPMFDGLLAYFPDALAWVSRCSYEGNQQHNPGEPMHWAMDKSTDHENKILRHMMAGFTDDGDGVPHSVKVAWRALARAQEDLMRRYGAPMPPNARRAHTERGNPVKQTDEE